MGNCLPCISKTQHDSAKNTNDLYTLNEDVHIAGADRGCYERTGKFNRTRYANLYTNIELYVCTATDDLLQNSVRVTNIAPDIHSGHVGSFNRSSQKQSIILNGYPNGMGDELAAKGMFFVK